MTHRNLKKAQEDLLEQFTPLVRKIAGGFQRKLPRSVLREDLIAAGMSGLWDAIRKHPDGGDDSFEWYARVRIRGAILDELRSQDWLPRRARAAAEANAGTDAYVPPPSVVRIDDVSEWEQNRCLADNSQLEMVSKSREVQILMTAIENLEDRDRFVLESIFVKGDTALDVAKKLGVSEPRVSQLKARALKRVKSYMQA